jgi:tRNA-splicing ligase RtcB
LQKEVKNYRDKKEYFRIDPETAIGKTYLTAHRAAANFGFANRTVIMQNIKRTLEGVLGKTVELKVLCDIPHVFVEEEEYQGKKLFVHRNGASRGYGPEKMKDHSLFSQTGEPGILAGSMSTPSYFVAGTDQNHSTFFSINHGAGKSPTAKSGAPRNKEELSAIMEENKIKLYNARSKGVVYQSGKYYKDINTILKSVQDFNIASPIAKMQPVAVLMA